jgi:signal transduction histidine kinase
VRAFIAGAHEGVDRGVELTSQLLSFAELRELDAHPADANALLTNLSQFLSYGACAGIRIVFDLAADLPRCLIDASQFSAAILNLVLNARDAMRDGGEIRIRTDWCMVEPSALRSPAPGAYVRVRVKDNGRGMSAETTGKIFDPFFTTKGERGTGLGLPQVRTFMRLIGGDVTVVSDLGKGATFDLLFPSENNPKPITNDQPPTRSLGGRRRFGKRTAPPPTERK